MGVAFVGKGLGMLAAVVPGGVVTPSVFITATYRILAETGFSLVTETSQYLRTEQDG